MVSGVVSESDHRSERDAVSKHDWELVRNLKEFYFFCFYQELRLCMVSHIL